MLIFPFSAPRGRRGDVMSIKKTVWQGGCGARSIPAPGSGAFYLDDPKANK